MAQPDADSCEIDKCEVIGWLFLVSGSDGTEMLELVEEAFDPISIAVKKGTEDRRLGPVCHRANVRPHASCGHRLAQCIAVIGSVREQDLPGLQAIEHIGCTASVMRLSFGELDRDRQAI